jgi:hypothetical protein
MAKRFPVIILVLLWFLILGAAEIRAAQFSADVYMGMPGKPPAHTGKTYVSGDMYRMEVSGGGASMISIIRLDRNMSYMIMPAQKMYMEMPLKAADLAMSSKPNPNVQRQEVGRETIDGHPTIKYRVSVTSGGRTSTGYQWMATDINFPVKYTGDDGSSIEYRSIKVGILAPSLFEIPAGYTKMAVPGMR